MSAVAPFGGAKIENHTPGDAEAGLRRTAAEVRRQNHPVKPTQIARGIDGTIWFMCKYIKRGSGNRTGGNGVVQSVFVHHRTAGSINENGGTFHQPEPGGVDEMKIITAAGNVQRNKIRDVDLLARIIAYVMANVGNTFSATSLAKFLKSEQRTVAPETILNYIKYCCEAYLLYQVKRENLYGKQILASNEKYYIADHGIREAVFGGNTRDINLILENIVYLELLRRGYAITVGRAGDKEIDFVCDKRGEKLYVQVAYLLASEETVVREFGAYDGIRDNFPKYVVSLDAFDRSRNGIKHRNLCDFLLMQEWN